MRDPQNTQSFGAISLKVSFMRGSFRESPQTSVCGWKGTANYYDVVVSGAVNEGAAWYYPTPKDAAANIKGRIAFWKGVTVEAG